MKIDPISSGSRKAVNISLDTGIVEAARNAGLNLSKVCEQALREATRKAMAEQWREHNRAGMEAWGDWIDRNGLPLEDHRAF